MLDPVQKVGKTGVLVGLIFWGAVFALGCFLWLLAGIQAFVFGDFVQALGCFFFGGVLFAVLFFFAWVAHDAKSELKNIQIQKRELKDQKPLEGAMPEVPPKEPWLFP
jgi:hypothetical protein